MEKQLKIELITGDFEPSGAADVLISMINEKIKFHTLKTLNLHPDSDPDNHSEKRIGELKHAKTQVIEVVKKAFEKGYQLEIYSSITINKKPREIHPDID